MEHSPKSRAAQVSVASNATLVVLKLIVGIISGSVSIISEAIHSANDLLAAIIAFVAVRVSDRPPDTDHPYGHGKAESISGVVEAALIMAAGVWIVVEAVKRILHGGEVEHLGIGAGVMAVSVVVNTLVARYLFKVARAEDSIALEADAQHLSTDVYTSLGVMGGLIVVWITDWHIIDPLVAIAVAILIGWIGLKLTLSAGAHLMDTSLPEGEVARIEDSLRQETRILSYHRLRTRKSGSQRHIDLHVVLSGDTTFREAHQIADDLEKKIANSFEHAHVVIHVDPYDPSKEAERSTK